MAFLFQPIRGRSQCLPDVKISKIKSDTDNSCNAGQSFEIQISGAKSEIVTHVNEELINEQPETDRKIEPLVD